MKKFLKTVNHDYFSLEGFLPAIGKTLIKEVFRRRCFERLNKKTREIYEVLLKLKKSGSVCVPTDKNQTQKSIPNQGP